MEIRVDRVTRKPGLIASGQTYSIILNGDNLYLIRTGSYIDFDRVAPRMVGVEGLIAGKLAEGMIKKMYGGRSKDIEEMESKINDQSLDSLAHGEKSYVINLSEIEEATFKESAMDMKLVTKQGKFKFHFSSAVDEAKATELVRKLVKS